MSPVLTCPFISAPRLSFVRSSQRVRVFPELCQESPYFFQRARVGRWDLVPRSRFRPKLLQSAHGVLEEATERADFPSPKRSALGHSRAWSSFRRACPLPQGGENLPNRVGYGERSRQLPPCSPLGCPLRQRAIDGISALSSRNEEKDFGREAVWVLALVERNLRVVVRELADDAFISLGLAQR